MSKRQSNKRKRIRSLRNKKASRVNWAGLAIVILIILGLPLVALLYYNNQESAKILYTSEQFWNRVADGEFEEAEKKMLEGKEELDEWEDILDKNFFKFDGVESSRLTGFIKGRAEISFSTPDFPAGNSVKLDTELIRKNGQWMISNIPELQVFPGAYVMGGSPLHINLFYQGEDETFYLDEIEGDLGISRGDVVYSVVYEDQLLVAKIADAKDISRLISRTNNQIEGEKEGFFDFYMSEPPVYKMNESRSNFMSSGWGELIVGHSDVKLHLYEGQVLAIEIMEDFIPEKIRVAINDSDHTNLSHEEVNLYSDGQLKVVDQDSGEEHTVDSEEEVQVRATSDGMAVETFGQEVLQKSNSQRRIRFTPQTEDGKIYLPMIEREGWGEETPSYRGEMDVSVNSSNELILVNELPLEEYLYGVVPSEMPQNFGVEGLQVQAVISRSYAYRGVLTSNFWAEGAHLDDSVKSQVYNNYPENEPTVEAVQKTEGKVPFYEQEPILAYFFSTSSGHTANPEEVWADPETREFPGENYHYLQARCQVDMIENNEEVPGEDADDESSNQFSMEELEELDLEREEELKRFIDNIEHGMEQAFDGESPYFRWEVSMHREELEASIEANLGELYKQRPEQVLSKEEGDYISKEISEDPVGTLQDIEVIERGEGGNIMKLDIIGSNGDYRLISEYTIRSVLRPMQYQEGAAPIELKRGDGTTVSDFGMLPSAFAYFELSHDDDQKLEEIVARGGGWGHGVGLSQYGARKMIEEGYELEEVLKHYYPGTELGYIYD